MSRAPIASAPGRAHELPPRSAASGLPFRSWKAPPTPAAWKGCATLRTLSGLRVLAAFPPPDGGTFTMRPTRVPSGMAGDPLFLRGRRGNRIAPGHVFDEIVRRAVFSRPLRLGVLGPGVFAVLAEEFLVN